MLFVFDCYTKLGGIILMNRRAITITEIIVILSCIAFMSMALATCEALGEARVQKDKGQLSGIAASFAIFAESDRNNQFPIPGSINRLAITGDTTQQVQGVGPQDASLNLSGWLHSAMIAQNYYGPGILISSNECNPIVTAKGDEGSNAAEIPYDFSMVDVASDSYWDPLFSGDITGEGEAEGSISGGVSGVCHTSYANLALCGERLKRKWVGDGGANNVILSSRGPELRTSTDHLGVNFSKSPTLQLYGPINYWEGIFVSGDGSAHYANDMWFKNREYTSRGEYTIFKDNGFMCEFVDYDNEDSLGNAGGAGGDNFMVLNVESTAFDVRQKYDLLLP